MANIFNESLAGKTKDATIAKPVIGRQNPQVIDGKYTAEIMWSMGRISTATASGTGKKIADNVTYYSVE